MKRVYKILVLQSIVLIILLLASDFKLLTSKEDSINQNNCINSNCHNNLLKMNFIHEPLKKDCNQCHKLLQGKHPEDLGSEFELNGAIPKLCFDCHKKDASEAESIHPLFEEGNCMECHLPHGSNNKALLVEFNEKAICLKCHNQIDEKKNTHKPSLDGQCIKCHNPHFSSLEKLIKKEQPALCLDCHDKPIKTEKRMLSNIKEKLSLKKVHSPVESGKCTDCHAPHSSENNALLIRKFFPDNYIEGKFESFQLCFACHSEQLMISPTSDSLTNFRDGTRNLHFVHVNKIKGRNCIDCHDVHGSNNLRTIKDFVEFGNWKMPMKFIKFDDGGTCSPGCHKKQSYTYINKHSHEPIASIDVDTITSHIEETEIDDSLLESDVEFIDENSSNTASNKTINSKSIKSKSSANKRKRIIIKKDVPKSFAMKQGTDNEITDNMKPYLSSLTKYLKKNKKSLLIIEVLHNYENVENPQNFAEDFAKNVLNYFVKKGILHTKIIIKPQLSSSNSNKKIKKTTIIFKVI